MKLIKVDGLNSLSCKICTLNRNLVINWRYKIRRRNDWLYSLKKLMRQSHASCWQGEFIVLFHSAVSKYILIKTTGSFSSFFHIHVIVPASDIGNVYFWFWSWTSRDAVFNWKAINLNHTRKCRIKVSLLFIDKIPCSDLN